MQTLEFALHENEPVEGTQFLMKGLAGPVLVLIPRQNGLIALTNTSQGSNLSYKTADWEVKSLLYN